MASKTAVKTKISTAAASLRASLLAKTLLGAVSDRMREVLDRRFGLTKGKRETLEAIGESHAITRERVRQIEASALEVLQKPEIKKLLAPFIKDARAYLERYGGVRRRDLALADLGARWGNERHDAERAEFILEASRMFYFRPENGETHALWALDKAAVARAGEFVRALVDLFGQERHLLEEKSYIELLKRAAQHVFGKVSPGLEALKASVETSKLIERNPFGMYGLISWPEVSPRGVRDYAYLVFRQIGRPLHFRQVAQEMNKILQLKRRAHEQTVHNELIKDTRFVLVGRGIYALKEWGYESGTVREVLATILASSKAALTREEIMERISARRMVKENTVFLNLQNRKYFVRLADGRYSVKSKGVGAVERA